MEVFGSFEATEVAREGNFGVIMYARRAGTTEKKFAIKVFRPSELTMDESEIEQGAGFFLESAQAQQQAHGAFPGSWAPVYEMGKCPGGAWYATDLMECSLEWLRITQKDLEPEHIRKIVEPVVQGLLALKQSQKRGHGNLRSTNVLLQGRYDIMRARIVVCDPKPGSRCRGAEEEARDARDVGDLVHQLILHKQFQNATEWPLQSSDRWQRLGRVGAAWLELVNKLIDPTTTKKPPIEEIAAMLPGGPVKAVAAAAGAAPAKDAGKAEAERKAREEKAKEEELKRKAREAEIARQVREEAEKKAKEKAEADRKAAEEAQRRAEAEKKAEAERKAEAQRKAEADRLAKEEADRKAREAEAARKVQQEEAARRDKEAEELRRAERERLDAEKKAQDAEKRAKDEAARKEKDAADTLAREAEAAKLAQQQAERKAEAERKAQAEKQAKEAARKAEEEAAAAKRRAAEEAAAKKAAAAAEAAAKKAEAAAAAQAAKDAANQAALASGQPVEQTPPPAEHSPQSFESTSKPVTKSGGSKKGIMAAAALVVVAGAVGAVLMLKPGPTPPPTPDPGTSGDKNSQTSSNSGSKTGDGTPDAPPAKDPPSGVTAQSDPKPPQPEPEKPRVPTAPEIAAATTKLGPTIEAAVKKDLAEAADAKVRAHASNKKAELQSVAAASATKVAQNAALSLTPEQLAAAAGPAADAAVRSGFPTGLDLEIPTRSTRPALNDAAKSLESAAQKVLPGAASTDVAKAAESVVDSIVGKIWPEEIKRAQGAAEDQLVTEIRDSALASAKSTFQARQVAEKPPAPTPPPTQPPPTAPTVTDADLQKVRDSATVIARMLDSGDAASDAGAEALKSLEQLSKMSGYDQVQKEPGIAPLRARVESLAKLAAVPAGEIIPAVQGASSESAGASELIAAWNRLGNVGLRADLQQVGQARAAAIARAGTLSDAAKAKVLGAVDGASKLLWTAQAEEAGDDAALSKVRAAQQALGVTDQSLAPTVAFNFALMDFKDALRKAPEGAQRAELLKAPAQAFVQKVEALAPIAGESIVKEAIQGAKAIIDAKPAAAGPADLSRAGPGSVGWTAQIAGGGDRVVFSPPPGDSRFNGQSLAFRRAGTAYLCETEVPLSLFFAVLSGKGSINDIKGNFYAPESGLRTWRAAPEPTRAATVAGNAEISEADIERWGGRPAEDLTPQDSWPVQSIGPKAAMVVAAKVGCRLPTLGEWRAAAQSEQGVKHNLRDQSWLKVSEAAAAHPAKTPISANSGAFKVDPRNQPVPCEPDDDGHPFFAPVDDPAFGTSWKHLFGNVAEWVITEPAPGLDTPTPDLQSVNSAWTFAVVGGSAVGPPSLAKIDQAPADKRAAGYFDVGLRLAFTAPGGSVAAAPSVDGTVGQLVAMQYLPRRSK